MNAVSKISFVWVLVVLALSIPLGMLSIGYEFTTPQFSREPGVSEAFLRQTNHSHTKPPIIIGHRGTTSLVPENTMMSTTKALGSGADIIHANIRRNAENKIFFFADETISRFSEEGDNFRKLSNQQVQSIDAGYSFTPDDHVFPFRGKGLHVPNFYEWMIRFPEVPILLEIEENSSEIIDILIDEMKEYLNAVQNQGRDFPLAINERVVVMSKYLSPLLRYRERTRARFASSCSEYESLYVYFLYKLGKPIAELSNIFEYDVLPKCQVLTVPTTMGSYIHFDESEFISFANSIHMDVIYRSINTKERIKELLQIGADGIITDRCDYGARALVELGLKSEKDLEKQISSIGYNVIEYDAESQSEEYVCATIICTLLQDADYNPSNLIYIFVALLISGIAFSFALFTSILICCCCSSKSKPKETKKDKANEKTKPSKTGKNTNSTRNDKDNSQSSESLRKRKKN